MRQQADIGEQMDTEQTGQRELTSADYVVMMRRHWVLILVLTLIGPALAYGVSRFLPDRYKSQTLVLVEPPAVPTTIVPQVDVTNLSQRLASMKSQILSRSRLEPIIRQFGLYQDEINSKSMDELVAKLQASIDVTPVQPMAETGAKDLPGFYVTVTLDNARSAQGVCTAITSMFIEESLGIQQQHSEQTTQFLSQQLAEAKADLDAQDGKLAAFKAKYIGSLPDDQQTNLNILTGMTSQLDAATQGLVRAQQDKSFAESMLEEQVAAWQASQGGHNPESLEQQLILLQTQLADLQGRYTDDYPDVIKTKADIAALQKKIAENAASKAPADPMTAQKGAVEPPEITRSRAQVRAAEQMIAEKTKEQEQIKQQIKLYQGRIQMSPEVEEQYKELTRGYQTAQDSYNDLLKKQEASAMSEDLAKTQQGEYFRVLDPADLPSKPTFPNRPMFALGGLGGGLALGIGLAFFLEIQDKSLRTERDVEFALRLPVLAMVPAIEPVATKKPHKRLKTAADSGLGLSAGA
jgi:polysaccharide chain length determinant protein (PEP-CTERM system associated)